MATDEEAYAHCTQTGFDAYAESSTAIDGEEFNQEFIKFVTSRLKQVYRGEVIPEEECSKGFLRLHNYADNDFYVKFVERYEHALDINTITDMIEFEPGIKVPHPVPFIEAIRTRYFRPYIPGVRPKKLNENAYFLPDFGRMIGIISVFKESFKQKYLLGKAVTAAGEAAVRVNQFNNEQLEALQRRITELEATVKEQQLRNKDLESEIFVRRPTKKPKLTKDQEEAGLTAEEIKISCRSKSSDPLDILRYLLDNIRYDQSNPVREDKFVKIDAQTSTSVLVEQMKLRFQNFSKHENLALRNWLETAIIVKHLKRQYDSPKFLKGTGSSFLASSVLMRVLGQIVTL
eukprot:Colp12_sorted_trinity150504_noHs@15407